MTGASKPPIALVAFDRPDYLRAVLLALRQQEGGGLQGRELFLFQDGGANPFSGQTYASQETLEAGRAIFRELFAHGQIFASDVNLGIGLHFEKIETYLFAQRGFESAIFLEDDFVPSPLYLRVIDGLLAQARNDPRIGYVSAVGEHLLGLNAQRAQLRQPQLMRQNWAFGLTRRQWLKNQPLLRDYAELIRKVDYRQRPHDRIFDLYTAWGAGRMESSQDRAKFIATTLSGGLRLNTAGCYGQYIGKVGVHSNADLYRSSGFADTQLCPDPIDGFDPIGDDLYRDLLARQRRHIMPPPKTIRDGATFTFVSGSPDCPSLGAGFHGPESIGTWTSAETAEMNFLGAGDIAAGTWEMRLGLKHYLPAPYEAGAVRIMVDGHAVGTATTSRKRGLFTVTFPGSVFSSSARHQITLAAAPLTSPSAQGEADDRRLGALLSTLRLRRIGAA